MLTVLSDADLYVPEPRGRRDLVVAGGQILAICEPGQGPPASLVATRIDCGGAALVPGFIDAHVHVTGGGGEAGPASRVPPIALGDLVRAGVTSVVGVLGTDCSTRTMRDLVARTLGLRAEGISAWCWTGGYVCPPLTLTGSVRDDIVFVDPIIGVGELALSDHRSSQPTLDELLRVAADCHVAGMHSGKAGVLHLHLGDGGRGLELVRRALTQSELPARVFQPTHVNRNPRLFAEALELGRSHGLPLDLTAFAAEETASELARALASGARVTCSSDGCGSLPEFDADGTLTRMGVGQCAVLAETFAALVAMGTPLATALPPFTSQVAAQLRLPGKGTIAVGGDADLLLLDEHWAPRTVLGRGKILRRDGVQMTTGMFERSA
jgi:beta-aspartyl-dipeptidase (metallo-type)